MVIGFEGANDFAPVVGWELYEVRINKYHVMFYFENGWQLLNVADAFSHRSADRKIDYSYQIYGQEKSMQIDRLLLEKIQQVSVTSPSELCLLFSNGDELIIHDSPEYCSWWFTPVHDPERPKHNKSWSISDCNPEDVVD